MASFSLQVHTPSSLVVSHEAESAQSGIISLQPPVSCGTGAMLVQYESLLENHDINRIMRRTEIKKWENSANRQGVHCCHIVSSSSASPSSISYFSSMSFSSSKPATCSESR